MKYLVPLVLLFLAVSAASAFSVERNLTNTLFGSQDAFIYTDLDVQPSISSQTAIYCTGETFQPEITVQSYWFSSVYSAAIRNNADTIDSLAAPYSALNQLQPLNWVNAAVFSNISSKKSFTNVTTFEAFMVSLGISPASSPEASNYLSATGVYSGTYQSDIGMYAKGSVSLVSSNSAYSSVLSQEYNGSPSIAVPLITLSQEGAYSFKSRVELSGTVASARTYLDGAVENVYIHKNTSYAAVQFDSPEITISVESPFSCSAATVSSPALNTSSTVPNGSISFSFTVSNSGSRNLSISAITLASGSNFSNLAVTSPSALPITIPANGGSQEISGTVNAPAAIGVYPLRFSIASQTTSPDCSGNLSTCDLSTDFGNVNVSSSATSEIISLTCWLSSSRYLFPGGSLAVIANCTSGGSPRQCPTLNWSTNVNGGNMLTAQTYPPSRVNVLRVSTASPEQNGSVFVSCADSARCAPSSCSVGVTVTPVPNSCVLQLANHSDFFTPNDAATVQANCTISGAPAVCPDLSWSSNIDNSALIPASTPANPSPSSNFSTHGSPINQTGSIFASSTNPALTCSPVRVQIGILGPDYVIELMKPNRLLVEANSSTKISVTVKNIGNQNATRESITRMLAGNCSFIDTDYQSTPPLKIGQSVAITDYFECFCGNTLGKKTVSAEANAAGVNGRTVNETNLLNNFGTVSFYCGSTFAPVCRDYV